MKKFLYLICFTGICLSWAACGSDETENTKQLPAPTVRLAERSGAEALLEWNAVPNAVSYRYYLTDETGAEVIPETGTTEQSARLSGLNAGEVYRFFVKALGDNGYPDSEYAECNVETLRVNVLSLSSDRASIEIVPTNTTEIYCYAMLPARQADNSSDEEIVALLQEKYDAELTDLWNTGRKKYACTELAPSTEYVLAVFMWSPTSERATSEIVRRHLTTPAKQIRFTHAVENYVGPSEDGKHDIYRVTLFSEGIEEQEEELSGKGTAICLELIAPVQQSTLIPSHLYTVEENEFVNWTVCAGNPEEPRQPSYVMLPNGEETAIVSPIIAGNVNTDCNDRIYTISGDLLDSELGNYSFTFKGRMDKVYDPHGIGDGLNGGPLVGIRFLVADGMDFGIPGETLLQFFFYPNEHAYSYKYMLLNDAGQFDSQSEEAWRKELLAGSEENGYYTGTDANREYYRSALNQEAVLMAVGISKEGVPGALTWVKTNGIIGYAGNTAVVEDGIGPWVNFVNPRYERSTLSVSLQASIRALHNFSCILPGNPIGEGTYTEAEISKLLAEGTTSNGIQPNLTDISYPAEPGEVVTFAVLGTNLDRIPGQLNWIALQTPAAAGAVPTVVARSTNTGSDTNPIGKAALSVTYSVVDAGTLPGYEKYPTFPAVIYEFAPNIYCKDYRFQGGFTIGEFEHNKESLPDYFASIRNSASYRPGGWYGRSSTDNDVHILIYNPATLGQSMDLYFIGYNHLGESGEPDYIQVDIPTELPAAPQSARTTACTAGVQPLHNGIKFPEANRKSARPGILPNVPTKAETEFGRAVIR